MSRFMPAVVAGEAMRKVGLRNPAAERLPEMITEGLARLAGFQHRDYPAFVFVRRAGFAAQLVQQRF